MKIPKLKAYDLVEIEWIDAGVIGNVGWKNAEEVEDFAGNRLFMRDLGYVLAVNKEYIIVTGGYLDLPEDEWERSFHRELKVPLGCVQRVRKLK